VRKPAAPVIDKPREDSLRQAATKAAAAPQPLPVHARQAAAPAVCEQQAEQARVCAALDGKNAALREQIGSLEGKVKSLQVALKAPPAPAVQAPPGPKPISAIKPLVPRKLKAAAPEPEAALPWGWIGGAAALLLALGGAWLLLRRRPRTVRNVDIPAGPRLIERLRHSLPVRTKAAKPAAARAPEASADAVEPSFD
jgi:pilus assembly protein FimV